MRYALIVMAAVYIITFLGCSPEKEEKAERKHLQRSAQHSAQSKAEEQKTDLLAEMRTTHSPSPIAAAVNKGDAKGRGVDSTAALEQLRKENEELKKELLRLKAELIRSNKMRISLDLQLREAAKHNRKQAKMLQDMQASNAAAEKKRRHDARIEAEKLRKAKKAAAEAQAAAAKQKETKGAEEQKIVPKSGQTEKAIAAKEPVQAQKDVVQGKKAEEAEEDTSFKPPIEPSSAAKRVQSEDKE